MRTVLKMGHTVNTSSRMMAGDRYNHAFHFCLLSTILFHLETDSLLRPLAEEERLVRLE